MRPFLLPALLAAIAPVTALATQDLMCESRTFKVTISVGSEGDAYSLVLEDVSGVHGAAPLDMRADSERHRRASIRRHDVDVEASGGEGRAVRAKIKMKAGKGTIDVNGKIEPITCDWENV